MIRHEGAPEFQPSFGRKRGKKLRPRQQKLWTEKLAQAAYAPGDALPENLHLEIGYGYGEHLAHKAALYPERQYIGCEVYENGVATMLGFIEERKLTNVRLYTEDARLLLSSLPDKSVAGIDILFADPWPKRKHNKRRIINQDTLDMLARLLPSGAPLFLATDHYEYLQWMMAQMLARPDFIWQAKEPSDWRTAPKDYVMTRYEAKARADGNNDIHYLQFVRA